MKQLNDYAVYASDYSAEGFWDKIKSVAKKAGIKVVYAALLDTVPNSVSEIRE